MTDCASCGLRLETLGGTMTPFCAVTTCPKYDAKSMNKARRRIKSQ